MGIKETQADERIEKEELNFESTAFNKLRKMSTEPQKYSRIYQVGKLNDEVTKQMRQSR